MAIRATPLAGPAGSSYDAAIVGCFPTEDRSFCRLVEALLRRERPATPQEFEASLRDTHPFAVVRPRELSGERRAMWYVYRDGAALARWASGAWWHAPEVARVRLDARGVFVDANPVAQRLAAGGSSGLVGRSFRDVARPGDVGIALMWRTLRETGRLDTVYTFVTPAGEPITVEVHAEAHGDEVVAFWRPIALAAS